MQRVRGRFKNPDGTTHGSLQSCIRTNDLDLVGDGFHLTFFQMLGNFHFGGSYQQSVELWHSLLSDLGLNNCIIHYHPDRNDHCGLWERWGYKTEPDPSCRWSDGEIGGDCCEVYCQGLEIGNLVNTLGHSVDVGFGWERLFCVLEGKKRVDETSVFQHNCLDPVVRDHTRTLNAFWRHNIPPGTKGRNYICRRLLRRVLRLDQDHQGTAYDEWVASEREILRRRLHEARKIWRRYRNMPAEWWWATCGILPEEIGLIQS